jgi:hypothetical protein
VGGGVDGTLDEELGVVVGVVLLADLPPPPHPTAKASTAAPPNSAIVDLAPDFIHTSHSRVGSIRPHPSQFHCRFVAAMLSMDPVTIQLCHRYLRAQRAGKGIHVLVGAMVARGEEER